MLLIYATVPPKPPPVTCAIVDPVRNVAVWYRRNTEGRWNSGEAIYADGGEGNVRYFPHVPSVVKILVEEKTGRKIRFGCS